MVVSGRLSSRFITTWMRSMKSPTCRRRSSTSGVATFLQARGYDVVCVNPSSVQGPPRASGNGGIIIAYLNGKLPAFVDTHVSLVDIQDCVEAHLLAQ